MRMINKSGYISMNICIYVDLLSRVELRQVPLRTVGVFKALSSLNCTFINTDILA